ncbi:MAG: hypothetical protein HC933_19770 [Pleurocapsa sp. SU_196_0]|nr:hypothetical protein [Pleurocapsa sp. SU_196_0]
MPDMLKTISLHHFSPLVGERFTVHTAHGTETWTLLEANASRYSGMGRTEPFSLIFQGPRHDTPTQSLYRLEHPSLEALEMFLVPIAATANGVQYQAIFN